METTMRQPEVPGHSSQSGVFLKGELLDRVTEAAVIEQIAEMELNQYGIDGDPMGSVTLSDALSKYTKDKSDPSYQILKDAVQKDSFANLEIVDISKRNGAVITYNRETNTYTFAFCGTRKDHEEWLDNAIGIYRQSSPKQEDAALYFDSWAASLPPDANVVVTGHSKGGNKAQYVTMFAKERARIDHCVALDGQGFSNSAMEAMEAHDDFKDQCAKITLVCGENDYVHVLGNRLATKDNTYYLVTNNRFAYDGVDAFVNDHISHDLFAQDGKGNYCSYLTMSGKQGPTAAFLEKLSEEIMKLSIDQQQACADGLMRIFQGEVTEDELPEVILTVVAYVGPDAVNLLMHSEEGKALRQALPSMLLKNEQMQGTRGTALIAIMYFLLYDNPADLIPIVGKLVSFPRRLLRLLTRAANIGMSVYDTIKHAADGAGGWVDVNFGGGKKLAEYYNRSREAEIAANEYMHIRVDTQVYRECAERLHGLKKKLEQSKNAIGGAFFKTRSKFYPFERELVLLSDLSKMSLAMNKMNSGIKGIEALAKALNRMADILEETEKNISAPLQLSLRR